MTEGPRAFHPTIDRDYSIICQVGSGGYGEILKGVDLIHKHTVALKRFKAVESHAGISPSFYREKKCLEMMKGHPNIVTYYDTISSEEDNSIYIVMEYCEYDLKALIDTGSIANFQKRSYIQQILTGLSALHSNNFIHRDIKPSNILVTRNNVVKLADFGLARTIQNNSPLTTRVMTLNYRPIEILLGGDINGDYDQSADIWSTGCTIYELLTGKVLFKSTSTTVINQLDSIFQICGTPSPEELSKFHDSNLAMLSTTVKKYPYSLHQHLEENIPQEFHSIITLLEAMLQLNPKDRITAEEALQHPFFTDNSDSQFITPMHFDKSEIRLYNSPDSSSPEITSAIESDEEFTISKIAGIQSPEVHSYYQKQNRESNLSRKLRNNRNDFRPERILPRIVQ